MCWDIELFILVSSPKSLTEENLKFLFSEKSTINFPWSESKNSPFSSNNFRAFHSVGLWLAVIMIPPLALYFWTIISTVGVVDRPRSTTSTPIDIKEDWTRFCIISPEILASLPIITLFFLFGFLVLIHCP